MNVNISLTLDEEEQDALTAKIGQTGHDTIAEFLTAVLAGDVAVIKDAAYQASLARLGEGFRPASYATRKTIIANLESQLTPP